MDNLILWNMWYLVRSYLKKRFYNIKSQKKDQNNNDLAFCGINKVHLKDSFSNSSYLLAIRIS